MAKRFTDTDKYKKAFIRSLPGPYKLLWDYLYHDCDHAGIWHKDFQIAQIYLGQDMQVNEQDALKLFNKYEQRIIVLNSGSKWFIRPFLEFQYGHLNPENRVHSSILAILKKEGIKGLERPSKGSKDKDKDKDKDSSLSEEGGVGETGATDNPKELTPVQKVVTAWKMVTGYGKDDKSWDKAHFARCSRSAKTLIDFLGSWESAVQCVDDIYQKYSAKGLTMTLETIVKASAEWKKDQCEKESKWNSQ